MIDDFSVLRYRHGNSFPKIEDSKIIRKRSLTNIGLRIEIINTPLTRLQTKNREDSFTIQDGILEN